MKPLIRFPDNKKCPRCGYQMPLFMMPGRPWHGDWHCPACDALLEYCPLFRIGLFVLIVAWAILFAVFDLGRETIYARLLLLFLLIMCGNLFIRVRLATWHAPLAGEMRDRDPASVRRRWIREKLFSGIIMGIGIYAGLCILGFTFQGKILYHPTRWMDTTPADAGLSYDDVFFEAADGVKLNAWFVPADDARGVVIFCHGNAGNISNRLDSIRIFHDLRLSTFIFDYRGYGRSEGKPGEEGTYLDAEAAWRHLTEVKAVPPEEIFVHGRSLGGAIAADLAAKHRPRGLILESTLTSVPDRAAEIYFWLPARVLSRFQYDTEEAVRQIRCPILIVHSLDDRLIPFSHGRALEQAAPREVDFLEISGDHNWGFITSGERYTDGLDAFLEKALRIRYPTPPE